MSEHYWAISNIALNTWLLNSVWRWLILHQPCTIFFQYWKVVAYKIRWNVFGEMSQGVLTHQMAFSYLWNIFDEQNQLIGWTVISLLVAYDQKIALFSDPNVSVHLSVCPSVCLSIRPSVRLSIRLSDFWAGASDPWPSGSGPDPQKGGFCQIYLLRGFWGKRVKSYLFGNRTMRWTKRCKRNFEFRPTARENRAGRRGWQGANQNFGISIFFYKRNTP